MGRGLVIVLAVTGCFRSEHAGPVPMGQPLGLDVWHTLSSKNLAGRVTMAGEPVRYFGVTATRDHTFFFVEQPFAIRTADGRFSLEVPPGEWDIVIAGPGFARHVVRKVKIDTNRAALPLEVRVEPGRAIDGQVTDTNGDAVAGVAVTIESMGDPSGNLLSDLARNNFVASTDAHGQFRFAHLPATFKGRGNIAAFVRGVSATLPRPLEDAETTVALVLQPVGTIEGVVDGLRPGDRPFGIVIAQVIGGKAMLSGGIRDDRTFRIEDVPVGNYAIGPFGDRPGALLTNRVAVVAGQVTTVRLVVP